MTTSPRHLRGFTLIEILVVIAIINLLGTVVYASLATTRAKAADTAKKAELNSVRTALTSFYSDNNRMPRNYDCSGPTCVVDYSRSTLAIEDTSNPDNPTTESGRAYRASMQELVGANYLSKIPRSPGGAGYTYYDYGPGSTGGAIIGTSIDTDPPTNIGQPGTCRPFRYLAQNPVGDLGPEPEPERCYFVDPETGTTYEDVCPNNVLNFCAQNSSKDYCLCNRY